MNDARRKQIQQALALIEQAKGIFEVALAQEQEDFENMPEDLRNDEHPRGHRSSRARWYLAVASETYLGF
jgi:hypothetical protein